MVNMNDHKNIWLNKEKPIAVTHYNIHTVSILYISLIQAVKKNVGHKSKIMNNFNATNYSATKKCMSGQEPPGKKLFQNSDVYKYVFTDLKSPKLLKICNL